MMLDIAPEEGSKAKCYFTSSSLPGFIDHAHLPAKKRPFSAVLGQPFVHSLDVMLPHDRVETLQKSLSDGTLNIHYATVYMKLGELIDGEFFNDYVKKGNVIMLSEGRPGIDHVFSLSEGILRLELDKITFQRIGLEGKAISNEGRKHIKARYEIEVNLRLPSMVRGKKGFERIIWAFHSVLNYSVKWLFNNLDGPNYGTGPIAAYSPKMQEYKPQVHLIEKVHVPKLVKDTDGQDYQSAAELLEWLTLAINGSPRIQRDDNVDPYLSRYRAPLQPNESDNEADKDASDFVKLHWSGFMPPTFINNILLATLKAAGDDWFAMSAHGFRGNAFTFVQNDNHTLSWEYED